MLFAACVVLFTVSSLGGVGLGLSPREALVPLSDWRFVVMTLVVNWIVCPALALVVLSIVPIARPYATGLALLALAPCAPFAPQMVRRARGDPASMAAFTLLSAVGTAVVMPLVVPRIVPGMTADPWTIARPLLLFVLLPLLLGTMIRGAQAAMADRLTPLADAVTSLTGVVLLLLLIVLHGRGLWGAVGSFAIAAQVLFTTSVVAAAYALGVVLRDEQRSVLTIGASTRNLGAALAPIAALDVDPRAVVMIAIAAPVTLATAAVVARAWAGRLARPPREAARVI